MVDLAVDEGFVEKSGAWYSYGKERIGQGRENARRFIKENPDVREAIADRVYAAKGLKRQVPAVVGGVDATAEAAVEKAELAEA